MKITLLFIVAVLICLAYGTVHVQWRVVQSPDCLYHCQRFDVWGEVYTDSEGFHAYESAQREIDNFWNTKKFKIVKDK